MMIQSDFASVFALDGAVELQEKHLRALRKHLDNGVRKMLVTLTGESLHVTWLDEDDAYITSNSQHATNRIVAFMKKHCECEELVEDCCKVIAYLSGDCARPDTWALISFAESGESFSIRLPEFSSADVGAKIWGAAMYLAQLILEQSVQVKGRLVVEVGAGVGLVGCVAAHQQALQVILTDFNQACLDACTENAHHFANARVQFLDWDTSLPDTVPWNGCMLLGAAVVYEPRHAKNVCELMHKVFALGGREAFISIHEEHSGFVGFTQSLEDGKKNAWWSRWELFRRVLVHEQDGEISTQVSVFAVFA